MAVDVDKRVQTTFIVVDRATQATKRLAQLMSGLGKATSNARRMVRSYGRAQTQMGQRVGAATKRISASTTQINRSAASMKRAATAANVAKVATRQSTTAQRRATTATRNLTSSTSSLRSTFILATAAAAGFIAVMQVRDIVRISKSFEDTQLAISGTVQALGFTKDFPTTLNVTAAAMEKIRIQAALLPGETQDYVNVFRAGLAGMRGSVQGTLNDMIKFSGRYTAIAKTMQIDSMQAGRDLSLMLGVRGRAGMEVRTFMQFLPVLRDIKGHANLTAKSFNEMSQQARGELLAKAFSKFDDAIAHAQNTFDALSGAFKSNVQLAKRLGGAPLYEGMKNSLRFMNDALMSSDGQMTDLMKTIIGVGEAISKGIVAGMSAAAAAAKSLYDWTNKAIGAMANMGGGGGMASAAAAGAGAGAVALGASGPVGIAIAAIVDFASRAEAVSSVLSKLSRFGEMLMVPFAAIGNAAMLVSGILGDVLEGALGGLISMITDVAGPVLGFFAGMINNAVEMFIILRPTLMNLWKAAGMLFTGIGKFLNPIIRIFGSVILGVYRILKIMLMPVLDTMVIVVSSITTVLGLLLEALGGWLGTVADALEGIPGISTRTGGLAAADQKNENRDFIAELFARFKATMKLGDEEALNITAPKARGGGGRTVNDFRYSRFTIDQKFAEGMDPDRIAVAFARDLGKIGEQKLQSGFEPLFSLA